MKRFCYCLSLAFFLPLLSTSLTGCAEGGNMGQVNGRVMFDGEPVRNATVTFTPAAGGRPSMGRTDAAGRYELAYTRTVQGAEVGNHLVAISTYYESGEDESLFVPETLPARYNMKTELTAEVKPGSNTFNFDLEPGGEIIQPVEN